MKKAIIALAILIILVLSGCSDNFRERCEEAATKDYDMENPLCKGFLSSPYRSCECVDWEDKGNSYQKTWHSEEFKLKK